MFRNKKLFLILIIIIAFAVTVSVIFVVKRRAEVRETAGYKEFLLSLSPSDVIAEHFKNRDEKNILRLNATVINHGTFSDGDLTNLDYVKILEILPNEHATNIFIEYLNGKNIGFEQAEVFDVTYKVKYKRSGPQDSGTYTWRYNLLKSNAQEPWLIESFGF